MAIRLSTGPIIVGGGVLPRTNNRDTSGTYLPLWVGGPGGFPQPSWIDPATQERYWFLHYHFRNGAMGMNAGLCLDKFRRYPNSPLYVLSVLAEEAETLARK